MHRILLVFAVLGGTAEPQEKAEPKEVASGYHLEHPEKAAATPASAGQSGAKKSATKKKMHSNAKRLNSGK